LDMYMSLQATRLTIVAVNPGPLRDGRYALIELTETDVKVSLRSLT